jgi:hypothetical protein
MQIRLLITKWVALCVGTFLMAGSASSIRAESWFNFKSDRGKSKVADDGPGADMPPPDGSDKDAPARAPGLNGSAVNVPDCPPEAGMNGYGGRYGYGAMYGYGGNAAQCKGYHDGCLKRCKRDPYRCSCYKPVNPWYCDPRDVQVYASQGNNVPITVPLAPMVQTYNYGWGIPSTRLSAAGNYASWQPLEAYTLSGRGRLPARFPTVYQPTDTTQLGYYYNYVPEWQPRW